MRDRPLQVFKEETLHGIAWCGATFIVFNVSAIMLVGAWKICIFWYNIAK